MGMLFALSLVLYGCGNDEVATEDTGESTDALQPVTVVLDWTPNTNHTGLYVAEAEGYFEDEGLDVEFIQPGEANTNQLVATGKADFGISVQESVTDARIQGIPVVSIGAIIQHNTSGFASPADRNITRPKDFEGKTYGGWGSPVEQAIVKTVMEKDGGDYSQLTSINIGSADYFTAVKQDIDFSWVFQGWTVIEAETRDEPTNMIYLKDYDEALDYYTPLFVTSEDMINEDPDTVSAFMSAVSKGYEFAIDNPDDAAHILLDANPDLDEELVVNSQEWLSTQYQDDASQWGIQELSRWENYANWLDENGLLEGEFDAETAYTNDFLPE